MSVFQPLNTEILPSGKQDSLFEERETQVHHTPYGWEKLFMGYVRDGNLPMVEYTFNTAMHGGLKVGKLSDSELRQAQYLGVVFVTMASRAAMESGMFEADAYNKSDAFIQKIDKETSPQAVLESIQQSMRQWTQEIYAIKYRRNFSAPIRACVDHIYSNMHSKITLAELSKVCCLSAPYLSTLFKKEVGENITTYIMRQRIKTAQEMLLNTNRSAKDIGYFLNFSSQSYFINCFKRECGVTPRQFRLRAFSSATIGDE
jgi:YesN/AraC family two-component response regulator